jgi:hypothetical protein
MRSIIVAVAILAFSRSATAQSAIVGAWEGIELDGQALPCHVIYTADGHFSRLCVAANRPKLKDFTGSTSYVAGLPKEELVRLVDKLTAQFGTYTVAGDKLTRKVIAAKYPNTEGTEATSTWRLENGELVVTGEGPTGKFVSRYHRAK